MFSLDKMVFSDTRTSIALNESDVKELIKTIFEACGSKAIGNTSTVEIWFSDGGCYKLKNQHGPTGWFNKYGIWLYYKKFN